MFEDRLYEPLGTRQKRWLDYLWYNNGMDILRTANQRTNGVYQRWEDVRMCVCPVDHRSIIGREKVIEFDNDNRKVNIDVVGALDEYLKKRGIITFIQDHNGRSPHLHVFDMPKNIRLEKNKTLKLDKLDMQKEKGVGLCREIGGTYYKEGRRYYASFFKGVDYIRPIEYKQDVRFPCLNLS